MTARHAVYWVPPAHHPLWAAGCAWLGRDPTEGQPPGTPRANADAAWRYGFHATVKAPLHLRDGTAQAEFGGAIADIAATHARRGVDAPALQVGWLRDFLVLQPVGPVPPSFDTVVGDCVRQLDVFRAPPDAAERARRIFGLDAEQTALYDQWGYPHLFHRWQMHLTLSDAVPAGQAELRASLTSAAQAHFADALAAPTCPGDLAWFVEPEPGAPFRLVQRFDLAFKS